MNRQIEREYRDALDKMRFSDGAKERMMDNLTEQQNQAEKRAVKGKRFRPLRAGLIAACLCLALVGTAAAAHLFSVRIVDGDNGFTYFQGGIVYYPVDSLSDEIKALDGTHTFKSFESWEAAEDFIGIDLMNNPLLDTPAKNYYVKFTDGGSHSAAGRFVITTGARLDCVRLYGCYQMGSVYIDVDSHLFTDRMAAGTEDWDERFLGYSFSDETMVDRKTYTTPDGLEAQILEIDRAGGHPDIYLAAFSLNGVPFAVSTRSKENTGAAREVLLRVLDGFQI